MEEPESQLHPHLQVALARRLTESVGRGVPVVAETHSVHVLRAVQLGVLEGRIQPKDIALYWVDQSIEGATSLRAIDVGSDATLQGWPPGVFEEEQALAREILAVRWAREDGP
jgi:predicted ATPase